MVTLSSWSHNEPITIKLAVGLVCHDKITFLDPVDLTGSGSVKKLLGDLMSLRIRSAASTPIWVMSTSPSRVRVEHWSDGGIGRMLTRRQGHLRTDQGRKPPPDGQSLEEVEGNRRHEVRVV